MDNGGQWVGAYCRGAIQPTEEIRTVQIGVKRKAKVMKGATAEGCGTKVAPLFFIVPPYVT